MLAAPPIQVVNDVHVTFDYWSTHVSNGSLELPITSEEYTVTAYYSAELLNTATDININILLTVLLSLSLIIFTGL